jgi:hypothetical protein
MNRELRARFDSKIPLRTSDLLNAYVQSLTEERTSVRDIVAGLGERGLGVLIAIFALPNLLPSTVPFGNVATGIPPLFLAVQLMLGYVQPILPAFIADRSVATATLKAFVPRVTAILRWFERLLAPRLPWVTGRLAERLFGGFCVVLAIASTLPIPFGHNLPALGLVLIGLGLIERDGAAILSGALIGLAGIVLLVALPLGLVEGLHFLLHSLGF